jgi:hypothetical protein
VRADTAPIISVRNIGILLCLVWAPQVVSRAVWLYFTLPVSLACWIRPKSCLAAPFRRAARAPGKAAGADGTTIVISERDWVDELIDAGVLMATDATDSNGNPIFRVAGFPLGEEGKRLKALFDRHVQGRDGRRRERSE